MTTAIKERGQIFNANDINAILRDEKTQFRVPMRPQPTHHDDFPHWRWPHKVLKQVAVEHGDIPGVFGAYVPGERLWVRETWAPMEPGPIQPGALISYRADYANDPHGYDGERSPEGKYRTWKPPVTMPRWASRITLEITDVFVERLNNISEADARAEGCEQDDFGHFLDYSLPAGGFRETVSSLMSARDSFRSLWESINGPGSWLENPWVWAIHFRRLA